MAEIILNKQHPLYQEDLDNILLTKGIDQLKGKSILITGATGLLGSCLIDALMKFNNTKNSKIKIIAIGRSKQNAFLRLGEYYDNPLFSFIEQDVREPLPKDIKVDYIIPGASNTHPLSYSQYPIETIEINVLGIRNALEKAIDCGAVVLCMSTVEVYGNARGNDLFTEDYTGILDLSNSRSCYTESKRVSEALCQSYIVERNAVVKIARLSRIFGPSMLDSDTKASSQFIKKALSDEDIVLKSKGEQLFSYTYVSDAVSAMLCIMLNGENGNAYNISGFSIKLIDFATICANYAGKKVLFDIPSNAEQKGYSIATKAVMDNSRLCGIGWTNNSIGQERVERTLSILRNN